MRIPTKDNHMQPGQLKLAYNLQIAKEGQFELTYGIYRTQRIRKH